METKPSTLPRTLAIAAACLFVVDLGIAIAGQSKPVDETDGYILALTVVVAIQIICALLAIAVSVIDRARHRGKIGIGVIVSSVLTVIGAGVMWVAGVVSIAFGAVVPHVASGGGGGWLGGAWGRPLRVRGRQVHPELTGGGDGDDWCDGARPDASALDVATRRALEALWLHDAQKEHASVPAFARVSWLLAAAGAPADLLVRAQRAGIEEIEHARACFALAAGYGGRTFTVEPMPALARAGMGDARDPLAVLAAESLSDGCQLEDFNADVAAACAEVCAEPVTRGVLDTIAREERGHAELSWAIVEWLVARHRGAVERVLARAATDLDDYPRPTAVSADKRELVARAPAAALRAHGRLPDERWAACWDDRLARTRARLAELLARSRSPRVAEAERDVAA